MKMMYCSECEEMVLVDCPDGHTVWGYPLSWNGYATPEPDIDWCTGPFYDSEPPTNDPDFDLQPEPSQKELVLMGLCAEELLQDLGVS